MALVEIDGGLEVSGSGEAVGLSQTILTAGDLTKAIDLAVRDIDRARHIDRAADTIQAIDSASLSAITILHLAARNVRGLAEIRAQSFDQQFSLDGDARWIDELESRVKAAESSQVTELPSSIS